MIPKQEAWNIVLAGIWNRAIFTPDWVGRLLFHEPEVETLISVMPLLPIIYRNRQVSFEVASARLIFRPREPNDACIQAAESMAHVVLDTLRDTPLLGVGVNLAYIERNPRPDLVRMFDFADNPSLIDGGWRLAEQRIVRKIEQGGDTLNLTLLFDGQDLTIEFNYHTETTENAVARAAVDHRAIRLRDASIRILDETYQLQPAEGDVDNG